MNWIAILVCFAVFILFTLAHNNSFGKSFELVGNLTYDLGVGQQQTKTINFYGLTAASTTLTLLTPGLVSENGELFNYSLSNKSFSIHKGQMVPVAVTIKAEKEGISNGNVLILENNSSNVIQRVPVKVDTGSITGYGILIVLGGFGTSVLAWTSWSYLSLVKRFNSLLVSVKDINSDLVRFRKLVKNYELRFKPVIIYRLEQMLEEAKISDIDRAETKLRSAQEVLSKMIDPTNWKNQTNQSDINLNSANIREIASKVTEPGNLMSAIFAGRTDLRNRTQSILEGPISDILKKLSGLKFDKFKYLTHSNIKYNLIISIGTLSIGALIGLGSLLQQDFLINLRTLNPYSFVILFTLGLGIDNVKQLLARFIQPKQEISN